MDYLVDVVEQYSKDPSWNLKFDYLEPFNEPDEGYWRKGNGQEGCYFPATQIAEVAKRTVATLKQRKLKTRIVGVDSWAGRSAQQFQFMTPDVVRNHSSFHVHGYVDPGQFRARPPGEPKLKITDQYCIVISSLLVVMPFLCLEKSGSGLRRPLVRWSKYSSTVMNSAADNSALLSSTAVSSSGLAPRVSGACARCPLNPLPLVTPLLSSFAFFRSQCGEGIHAGKELGSYMGQGGVGLGVGTPVRIGK